MPKRAGQSFDLAVAAMTVESMGVTPSELIPTRAVLRVPYMADKGVAWAWLTTILFILQINHSVTADFARATGSSAVQHARQFVTVIS